MLISGIIIRWSSFLKTGAKNGTAFLGDLNLFDRENGSAQAGSQGTSWRASVFAKIDKTLLELRDRFNFVLILGKEGRASVHRPHGPERFIIKFRSIVLRELASISSSDRSFSLYRHI